jgi:hypothetical protein
MTRFTNRIERIRVARIYREEPSRRYANFRWTRAFTPGRLSLAVSSSPLFGLVSAAFQSESRLPMVIPMVAAGSYVSNAGGELRGRNNA